MIVWKDSDALRVTIHSNRRVVTNAQMYAKQLIRRRHGRVLHLLCSMFY